MVAQNGNKTLGNTLRAMRAAAVACAFLPASMALAGQPSSDTFGSSPAVPSLAPFQQESSGLHPGTPMVLDPGPGLMNFDLAGSETRKLQFQLAAPLRLDTGTQIISSPALRMLGLDAGVNLSLAPGMSLAARADRVSTQIPFQTLGSIQCENGTLRADSYTASDCRFINDDNARFDRSTLSLGAAYDIGNVSTSLNWFTSAAGSSDPDVRKVNQFDLSPLLEPQRVSGASWLLGPMPPTLDESEISGIDLNFRVGYTTDQAGEVRLGLALTHVIDAHYASISGNGIGPLNWNLAEPYNQASLDLEWSKGPFTTGIRGYYHEPINFLYRNQVNEFGTFDVHFTWRTPWNANLSVGASNVLNAGVNDNPVVDKPVDRFESIYGRIPYVRYQQDL